MRVLLVDDDDRFRVALERHLVAEGFWVQTAAALAEATAAFSVGDFDVAVVDLCLGDTLSTELVADLSSQEVAPAVIVMSGYLDGDTAVELARMGAATIPKPMASEKLVALIRDMGSRRSSGDWLIRFSNKHRLSRKEQDVLCLAAQGLQNKEIAARLGCAHSTVMTYWKRIFCKTQRNTRSEVLSTLVAWQSQQRGACLQCPHGRVLFG